jgi:hypothetical protein
MAAINAAYRLLADPRQRAAYDARRYLGTRPAPGQAPRPASQPTVAVRPPPRQPTSYEHQVDRVVTVVGVGVLVAIGLWAALVIPHLERPSSSSHPTSADVPERLIADSQLKSFPGVVLVPPGTLEPFSTLPVVRVDATGRGIARYAVYYGDLNTGGASVSGLVGRAAFDNSTPRLSDCPPSAEYCAGPVPGQTAGPTGLELFRERDLIADYPAVVVHRVCCNGVFWSVNWYEPGPDVSYALDLSRAVALRFGSPRVEHDVDAARAVAHLAAQLARLS